MTSISINGFQVLPIAYSSSSTHYIYARAHNTSKKATNNPWPKGRTLFLVNVPPDATERDVILLFKPFGTVERVVFDLDGVEDGEGEDREGSSEDEDEDEDGEEVEEEMVNEEDSQPRKRRKVSKKKNEPPKVIPLPSKPLRKIRSTGQSVHVVFLDESSMDKCLSSLQSSSSTKPRPWPSSITPSEIEEPSGLAHYLTLYDSLRPPLDAVREHVDSAMELYEFEIAKTKQKSKYRKGEAIVDEDGFTLVTRGGAYGQTLGGGVGVASKKFQESGDASEGGRKRKRKGGKEKESFYAFQKAEKQRKELLELKKNWELDKAKVEKLKASRKFKPY